MRYRHACHAGNFADVTKHVALVAALLRLTDKDRPIFLLDTHAGRGRYAVFDVAMHERAMAHLQLETDLRRAVERQEFRIAYQPIIALATGRIAFLDNAVDQTAGTIKVRAVFDNADAALKVVRKIFKDTTASAAPVGLFYYGHYHTVILAPAIISASSTARRMA